MVEPKSAEIAEPLAGEPGGANDPEHPGQDAGQGAAGSAGREAGQNTGRDVAPGTVRPGGRTARVRDAVLRACADALLEHGFEGVDLADVARRAGVGKTTVYRRWGSVCNLINDMCVDMVEQSLPRADTGSLLGDLRANARLVQRTLADPRQGGVLRAVIAAALSDETAAAGLRQFYAARVEEWEPCVRQAIERGELPSGTDSREVIRAVAAPLYYRMFGSDEPLDTDAADTAAEAVVAAARAGAYVRPRQTP